MQRRRTGAFDGLLGLEIRSSLVPKLPLGNALLKSSALVWLQPIMHNRNTVQFTRSTKPPFADLEKAGPIDYEHEHEHEQRNRNVERNTQT